MRERILLFILLGVDALVLLYEVSTLSIASYEADIVYQSHSFLHYLIQGSLTLFGQNDYALRMPMIAIHLLSVLLLYVTSKPYVKRNSDRLWLVLVYVLLPGVISAALVVNCAGIVILALFFLLYLYQRENPFLPFALVVMLGLNGAFIWLYFAIFIYAFKNDNKFYMLFSTILFFIAFYLYGFDTMGRPSGHFLDTLGLYATIFSPVVFVFLVYALYRKMVTKEYDITLYIGGVVFVVSLLLSFRQRIYIEHFAPYMMLLLPLAAQTFFSSYRVRLRVFRGRYRLMLSLGFGILAIHFFVLLFNKGLYLFIEDPHKHFAYKTHVVKELSQGLKELDVSCVSAESEALQKRLRFYGIKNCTEQVLYEVPLDIDADVTIRYMSAPVANFNVTKQPI